MYCAGQPYLCALAKTFIYEYNEIGNLTAIQAYPFSPSTTLTGTPVTTTFGYTDDRLTSFGGATIGYNAMGCPTSYEGKTATWTKGKLSRLSRGTLITGMDSYAYTYNGYGQRIARNYTYSLKASSLESMQLGQLTACNRNYYYDHAGRLIAEDVTKTYYGEGTTTENIVFLYDESGIIGMELTTGGVASTYYFQRNLQGDVVAIYDVNGTLKAKYLYDAWGNCIISSETTSYDVANANPIRYRGYYYDDDTGLYYCNARYYSPKWRRFISPDDTAYLDPESVNGLNLYCYCNNDPVNYADPSGHEFEWWQKILIGTAFIVAGALVTAAIASTGGFAAAFGAALLTSIKATAVSTAIGAGIGFAVGAATTGTWQGAMNGMVDGAIDSFMWGGIFAGGAQIMSGIFKGYAQIANHFGKLKQVKSSPIFSPDRLKGATEIANIASKGQRFHDYGGTIIGFSKNIHLDASTRSLLHLAFFEFPHVPVGTVLAGIIGGF